MFVESLDTFLTNKFSLEKGSILRACIEHPKLRFVVDIDPKTKLETEASKELRKEAKLSRQRQHRRDRYNAMSPEDEREAYLSRQHKRQQKWCDTMSPAKKQKLYEHKKIQYRSMTPTRKEEMLKKSAEKSVVRRANLKAAKFVTDVGAELTDRDILIPKKGKSSRASYMEYREYVKSNCQVKSNSSKKEKQEIAIAIVKHFTDQNKRFFGYDETNQVRLLSNEGAQEVVKLSAKKERAKMKGK
jgi:hypothetical protein